MKKMAARLGNLLLVAVLMMGSVSGYAADRDVLDAAQSVAFAIENYRDIPGITEQEIDAIEAFKSAGRRFNYVSLLTTETYVKPDGTYGGFTVMLCDLLADLLGIPFDIHIQEWEDLIEGLNAAEYDFTGELTPTPERAQQYSMTRPIAERGLAAFSLAQSARLETESDMDGMRVGFLSDTITAQSILESYPTLSITNVEVRDTQDAIERLHAHTIDAFVDEAVSSALFVGAEYSRTRDMFSLVYTPIALCSANPEMKPIISVVDKYILAGGINQIHALYSAGDKEYSRRAFVASLAKEEAEYLRALSETGIKVPVALENEAYPISFYNAQDKEYQGIAPDVLREICAMTGLEIDIVTDEHCSWSKIFEMLETGEAALVSELLYTEEREGKFLFSESPYSTCHYALLSKMDYPNLETYQVPYVRVGVVAETAHTDIFEHYFPDHPNFKHYLTRDEAYDALESGDIDLIMASEYQLLDFVNFREKSGYKVNRTMNAPLCESYFGFNKNETLLCSIFDKAMKQIDMGFIAKAWEARSFDYERALAREREQAANQRLLISGLFMAVLFLAFVVLLVFIIRNMRKGKVIENQTAVINAIYNVFPDIVFTKDMEGRYTSANRSSVAFARTDVKNLLGKTASETFSADPEMASAFSKSDEVVLRENRVVKIEVWRDYRDGTNRLFEEIKTPLVNKGKIIGLLGVMRDITEQVELLEKIKYQSQYELVKHKLTNNALNIVQSDMDVVSGVPIDAESKVVWSAELKKMLGFGPKSDFPNVLGSLSGRIHPEERDAVLRAFYAHVNDHTGKTACDYECRIMGQDAAYKDVRMVIGTLRDETGAPIRIACAMEDITERKRIRRELDEALRVNSHSRHTLESILNGLQGMICVAEPDSGKILFVNDHMKKTYGLVGDCVGQLCYEVFQKDQHERCEFCPCHQLDKNSDRTIVWERFSELTGRSYRNTDGYIRWPDGRRVHLQYSEDVTDLFEARKMAEEQRLFVVEEHKRLQKILDILPIGVSIMRDATDRALLYANDEAIRVFNGAFSKNYTMGRPIHEFFPDTQLDGRKSSDVLGEFLQQEAASIEMQCARIDGKRFMARFTTCRINYHGEYASLAIVEDVTEEREYQQRLQDIALKELEANQAKSEFLAKMSHEIRTPMNAIIGLSELALREYMSDTAYEHVSTVKQAGVHLLAIINDVLDLSKIETGKMKIIPMEYSFSSLVNDIISIIRMRLFDSRIRFAVNIDSRIPNALIGDVTRIRQVLINVLGNAVKYTDKGFVALNVDGERRGDDSIVLSMKIKDSGRGIKKEDISNLFEEYMQSDMENNQGIEGVGLGLAISWSLVNAMHGSITVDSEYGEGSTFTITLPQKVSKPDQFATVENAADKRVIICERRKVYADSIEKTLENLDVSYTLTASTADLCKELLANEYPFILISYAVFNKNKDCIQKAAGNAKIVLLSEFGEAIPEGNWSVLPLPAHALSIANMINGVDEDYLYSTNAESTAQFSAPDARILVVDDIQTNLKVVEGLLKPYEMPVDLCRSGAEAIEAVQRRHYDLVFMDHRMPDMDGVEATKHIRALSAEDDRYTALPIIALTANAVVGMRELFLENGFDDYLSKPIDTNKLNSILEKWIRAKYGKRKAVAAQLSEKNFVDGVLHIDGINVEKGLLHVGGEISLLFETLAVFCDDGHEKAKRIQDALAAGDLHTYTVHVHALKSAAANVGASALSTVAQKLEMAGIREDAAYIKKHNEDFLRSLEKLLSAIKSTLAMQERENQIDMDAFREELLRLKTALENMDAHSIKIIGNKLKKEAPEAHAEDVKRIARSILMSEYDEAVALIEAIIQT